MCLCAYVCMYLYFLCCIQATSSSFSLGLMLPVIATVSAHCSSSTNQVVISYTVELVIEWLWLSWCGMWLVCVVFLDGLLCAGLLFAADEGHRPHRGPQAKGGEDF